MSKIYGHARTQPKGGSVISRLFSPGQVCLQRRGGSKSRAAVSPGERTGKSSEEA